MVGKVISFINMKGGVGKTTLCIGIGEYLAHFMGKKILFIDLDPQFNTTQSLLNEFNLEDKYLNDYTTGNENNTVKRLFGSQTSLAEKFTMPQKNDIILELDRSMHLIQGTIDLILVESDKDGTKARVIRKFIKECKLKEEYDFIFIDCPPTITVYTDAALLASDYYLVPNRIDRYSILGIKLLKQVIDRLIDNEELDIKPLGIVYTMIDNPGPKTESLKRTFENSGIVKDIGIFQKFIRYYQNLQVGMQGNISSKYEKSKKDIKNISEEFLRRIEGDEQ